MDEVISAAGRVHLRWALTAGMGPLTFQRLLIQFGDAERALGLPAGELATLKGVGQATAEQMVRSRDAADVDSEIAAAAERGARIICLADAEYPPGLKRIPDPPLVLYVRGELRPTDAVAVAVVGSRRCSIYGSEQARRFGELLAGAGLTVVSGLARGIDAFAHHGALDAGGRTIAVMGRGLNEIYPPENAALADRLLGMGAWVSELPMHAGALAGNFPGRNRIIAGMTLGTLVVEAAQRSGALITARLASEYNREVFAIPGRVQDAMSSGTNRLIRDGGAKLVTDLEDILCELGEVGLALRPNTQGELPLETPGETGKTPVAAGPASLTAAERRVYDAIGYEPLLADMVLRAAELPAGVVLGALTALELKGLIQRLPGNLVLRRGRA